MYELSKLTFFGEFLHGLDSGDSVQYLADLAGFFAL